MSEKPEHSKQLPIATQSKLHVHLNDKIDAAVGHIKRLKDEGKPDDDPDIAYLRRRIAQCNMCLRLTLNTDWITQHRKEFMETLKKRLDTEETLVGADRIVVEREYAAFKRASNCKRPPCYGKGWIGMNKSTGEFQLCSCTEYTLHLYKEL